MTHRSYTPGTQGEETARNELVLIERILAGEKELFMELVRPYQKVVFSMAVSMVKCDDAGGRCLTGSALQGVQESLRLSGRTQMSRWIIQIALNEAYHRIRKKQRAAEDSSGLRFRE